MYICILNIIDKNVAGGPLLVNISISLRNILEIDELRQVGESKSIIPISTQSFLPLLFHSCFIVYNGGNAKPNKIKIET